MRSFSSALSIKRSKVHLTSAAVKGLPSCRLTPWRSGKVNSVPSSFHDQLVAKSGTIDCRLACGTSCLYMTRLLNTPIAGRSAATVDSSRMDMLAGLSKCDSLRIPPGFWASAGSAAAIAVRSPPATATLRIFMAMPFASRCRHRLAHFVGVTALYGESGTGQLLVLSQVVLRLQLSFAVVPLLMFTSDRSLMGAFTNSG